MSLLNMAQPQPVQPVQQKQVGGLLMPPQQPQAGQSIPAMQTQQKDPMGEQLARLLMSDPSPATMKKIIEILKSQNHPKTAEVAQMFNAVAGNPQMTQKLIHEIQKRL